MKNIFKVEKKEDVVRNVFVDKDGRIIVMTDTGVYIAE